MGFEVGRHGFEHRLASVSIVGFSTTLSEIAKQGSCEAELSYEKLQKTEHTLIFGMPHRRDINIDGVEWKRRR